MSGEGTKPPANIREQQPELGDGTARMAEAQLASGLVSPLRATAWVGIGSAISLLAGAGAAKILAHLIGPEGVGRLGITQGLLNICVLAAGLGVSTGLVRELAAARSDSNRGDPRALQGAGEVLVVSSGLAGLLLLALFRAPVATAFLGTAARAPDVLLIGAALVVSLLTGLELAIVNGHQRIRALTAANVLLSVAAQATMVLLVAVWGPPAIAPALFAGASVGLMIALAARLRSVGPPRMWPSAGSLRSAGAGLLRFGIPFTASAVVGAGAQFVVPVLILNQLGEAEAGLYRAAATISVGYLVFMLAALTQDYYPRLAAASSGELLDLIEQRMRIVLGMTLPVILLLLAVSPLVIKALYNDSFLPAATVLDWQLAGDLLKLPAWALVFVLLARGRAGRYFVVEAVSGVTLLAGTWLATSLLRLPGAGVAYLVSYGLYYAAVLVAVRGETRATPGRLQLGNLSLLGLTVALLLLPAEFSVLRGVAFLVLAAAVAALAWPRLWRMHKSGLV